MESGGVAMTQATAVAADPRTSGRRRVLSGFVLFLACLTILVTTVAVWTHQVALNTDRFTSLVSTAVTEPAVTDPIATRITDQVVAALDVQGRLEARLPGRRPSRVRGRARGAPPGCDQAIGWFPGGRGCRADRRAAEDRPSGSPP